MTYKRFVCTNILFSYSVLSTVAALYLCVQIHGLSYVNSLEMDKISF